MAEQRRYHTKQQESILSWLRTQSDAFRTAEDIRACLKDDGVLVGQTTIYRTLERLTKDGVVVRIPSVDGAKTQYRYIGEEEKERTLGKLICLSCGKTIPLECSQIERFFQHIEKEHDFQLDGCKTVLYGYCRTCRKKQESKTGEMERKENEI